MKPLKKDQKEQTDKPDIPAIMQAIRDRIKSEQGETSSKFRPVAVSSENSKKAGFLLHSENLRVLNNLYANVPSLDLNQIKSHRPSLLGKLIIKVKTKVLVWVYESLKEHFNLEREFKKNLVRFLNDTSKYVDDRDASNFWELIKKIDYDLSKLGEHVARTADNLDATVRTYEKQSQFELSKTNTEILNYITQLQGNLENTKARLQTIESVATGLEAIVCNISDRFKEKTAITNTQTIKVPDYQYLILENRFRGSENEIQEKNKIYVEYFKNQNKPILEFGCGRGELLELFKQSKIDAVGIDPDSAMYETASKKGLNVKLGDGIELLNKSDNSSFGGLIATQVIEHLSLEQLQTLLKLCKQKIVAGGKIIFETINPQSLLALSSNYFRDPSHTAPAHPDTLAFLMSSAGIKVLDIKYLSPVPDSSKLKAIDEKDYMTPNWQHTIKTINANIQQLNSLLYGYQDFAIIGEI